MREDVIDALRDILGHHEGVVNFMYLDHARGRRRVTVGIGCLLESAQAAAQLRWHDKNNLTGPPVGPAVVRQEWQNVNNMQGRWAGPNENGWAFQNVTTLRMHANQLEALFSQRARQMADAIRAVQQLRGFDSYPPDAQLAVMVHAWALGPRGLGSNLRRACEGGNWADAARHSGWGGGARKRLDEVRIMFGNAEVVSDPRGRTYQTRVYWPERLVSMNA